MLSADFGRRFVQLSNDLICSFTLEGHIEQANPRWKELLGWSIEELRSRPWTAFVLPDDVARTQAAAKRAAEGEAVVEFENRVISRDGTVHDVLWSTVPAPEEGRVFGMGRDVTERRRRTNELERTRRLLAEAEKIAGLGSWQWSVGHESAEVSPQMRRVLGLGADDPATFDLHRALMEPADFDRLRRAMRETLTRAVPVDISVTARRRSGQDRVLRYRAEAELGPDGRVARIHGTVQDVSEEASRTRRLRRMTQAALEISAAPNVDAALKATTLAAREIVGARDGSTTLAHRPSAWSALERLVLERRAAVRLTREMLDDHPARAECDGVAPDGWLGAPLVAKHGETLGLVQLTDAEAGDFTTDDEQVLVHLAHIASSTLERLELEHRFLQAQRVEAVGRLAAGIIHDFNNTLAVMLVRSELLQAAVTDPAIAEHAAELQAAARAAADVASDLLALSRTDSEPRPAPTAKPSDITEVVRDVARLARPMLGAEIGLDLRLGDEPLPTLVGRTDLHQVLMNLVLNARDAIAGAGTVTIEAAAVNDHILLKVGDDGIGMTPDTRARIFTPYFTTKADRGGTGLGLAGVQTIVTRAGGRIEVESSPGEGSTFSLHIPHAGRATAVVPSPASRALPGGDEPVAVLGRNRSVVAVLEALLDSLGYAVAASRPGREPELHGAALVVIEDPAPVLGERPGVPADAAVLYITGAEAGEGARAAGAHVLQRPVSADQLARTVRRILDTRHAELRPDAQRDQRTGERRRATDVHPSALDG